MVTVAESLNQKIEKMADRKAREAIDRMWNAICAAARTGHGEKPGDGTWFGDDFRSTIAAWSKNNAERSQYKPQLNPSSDLVNYYRSKILEEILEKLPLIKELVVMKECDQTND